MKEKRTFLERCRSGRASEQTRNNDDEFVLDFWRYLRAALADFSRTFERSKGTVL